MQLFDSIQSSEAEESIHKLSAKKKEKRIPHTTKGT